MENKKLKVHGVLSAKEIEVLKKKHGELFKIVVDLNDNEQAVCYLRGLTRNDKSYVAQKMAKSDIYEVGKYILANCKVGGDKRFETDDKVYDSAVLTAGDLFDFLPAELSKVE